MTEAIILDFSAVHRALIETHEIINKHDGEQEADPVNAPTTKERTARRAEVSRDLLYAAHLCDKAKVDIMNQYHTLKGQAVSA